MAGAATICGPKGVLAEEQVRAFVHEQLRGLGLDGRSVCVIGPDATRSCPLPLLLQAVRGALHPRVSRFTVLLALGTYAAMTDPALSAHLGFELERLEERYPSSTVLNHAWWERSTFAEVATIGAERIEELSDGMLSVTVPVRINRAVLEHELTLILGPVFPHEVVGFSGGNKYLFPGLSGRQPIDVSHLAGADHERRDHRTLGITPVRALINEAAALVPGERLALCVVTKAGANSLHSMAFGDPVAAWAAAAVSAEVNRPGFHGGRDLPREKWSSDAEVRGRKDPVPCRAAIPWSSVVR